MSSKQAHKLSGAEALEEYFTALLDEEWDVVDDLNMGGTAPLVAVEMRDSERDIGQNLAVDVQPQTEHQPTYAELKYSEFDVPDLDDVQKLLDKMESTDLAAEPEIATLIEQNTTNINFSDVDVASPELEVIPEEEEIQDWVIETEALPVNTVILEEPDVYVEHEPQSETDIDVELSPSAFDDWRSTERDVDFQVLYFDVNGITFAVPLDELGGIHKVTEMSHLIGRPDWYLGLQTNKDNQYDVVDTAKWVMADRLKDESYKNDYQYIVMLGDSTWGLAATELKGAESLNVENVRWRSQAGKRPWLAGMVKEKMCALIHVEAMITMITAGLDVKSLDIL